MCECGIDPNYICHCQRGPQEHKKPPDPPDAPDKGCRSDVNQIESNQIQYDSNGKDKDKRPILDTGASHCITPFTNDLVKINTGNYVRLRGVTGTTKINQSWTLDTQKHHRWSHQKCPTRKNGIKTTYIHERNTQTVRWTHRNPKT